MVEKQEEMELFGTLRYSDCFTALFMFDHGILCELSCLKPFASSAPNAYTFALVPVKLRDLAYHTGNYEGLHYNR